VSNVWSRLQGLFARDRAITRVTVLSVGSDGTSVVETPTSAPFTVLGDSIAVGDRALVQGGRIIGSAPSLPYYEVDV
jgi:hypothetical protein